MIGGGELVTPSRASGAAFMAFQRLVHDHCPDRLSLDLRAPERLLRRALCGDHGRVVPTDQNLCPVCAGYVEEAS